MTLESSKTLGGIGALLMFIGVFPYISFFGIIELVGLILVLAALHGFADYYKERAIFTNALYAVIAGIVGAVIAVAVTVFTILTSLTDFLHAIYPRMEWRLDNPTRLNTRHQQPQLSGHSTSLGRNSLSRYCCVGICNNCSLLYEALITIDFC